MQNQLQGQSQGAASKGKSLKVSLCGYTGQGTHGIYDRVPGVYSGRQHNSHEYAGVWASLATFIYLFGVYVALNTTDHIMTGSWIGRGNQYISLSGFCTVNCRPTASNYQLSHLRPCREPNPGLRGGRRGPLSLAT